MFAMTFAVSFIFEITSDHESSVIVVLQCGSSLMFSMRFDSSSMFVIRSDSSVIVVLQSGSSLMFSMRFDSSVTVVLQSGYAT